LTASASVAEPAAFAAGGWLVQLLTAPVTIFEISSVSTRQILTPDS